MWVPPHTSGIAPGYEQRDVGGEIKPDAMFPLASGREADAAITIHQRDATLWILRLSSGASTTIPDAPFVHVFVARGAAALDGAGTLETGDAARLTHAGTRAITASDESAELVIWETWRTVA
jgi:redox-sensitive bicupin YhaK (pirin superfamily)